MSSQPERSSQMALYGLHVRGLLLHRPNNPWTVAFVMGLSPSLASSMTASEGSTRAGAWARAPLQAPRCPGTVPRPCKRRPACTDRAVEDCGPRPTACMTAPHLEYQHPIDLPQRHFTVRLPVLVRRLLYCRGGGIAPAVRVTVLPRDAVLP